MNDLGVNRTSKSEGEVSHILLSAITYAIVSFREEYNVTSVTPTTPVENLTTTYIYTDVEVPNSTYSTSLPPVTTPVPWPSSPALPSSTSEPDSQALLYVSAIVFFYGAVLLTLLWMQLRRRAVPSVDEELYAVLINREELARRDMLLRHKLNVLRIDGIKDGYMLDHIPEHTLWYHANLLVYLFGKQKMLFKNSFA